MRIGQINYLDQYLGAFGDILIWNTKLPCDSRSNVIIRKIEKPKQYRPFANAEEFKPHRERWWMWKEDTSRFFPPASYDEFSHESETWIDSFNFKVFEDGLPFGVEVSE